MKNKIIISINPCQPINLDVIKDKENVYSTEFTANSFEKVVMRTISEYPDTDVYIQGPKDYTYKFGGLLLDAFQHTYSEKTLNIQYI